MKNMKSLLITIFTCAALSGYAQSLLLFMDESQPMEVRVQDALSRMTLEEKTRLCYAQSKFSSPGVPRLGIPELYMSDGPHGVRMEINWDNWDHSGWTNDYCTAFPALTCLAATWEPELARTYGRAIGEEARYRKKNILLGPGVNIFRTPLNGRNFEYMGEDPMLAGSMAVPYIQGLQSNGVACCLKHYALNNQEEFRGHVDVKLSDRALYEIYLPAFKRAVVEGQAWSIMGSYNKYQSLHASHHPRLINEILKGEWQFKGAVITDWGACHNTDQAIRYGLDIEMGSYTNGLTSQAKGFGYDDYYLGTAYLEKCRRGEVPEEIINDKAARILRLIFLTSPLRGDRGGAWGSINSPEHVAAARQIASEGIILLKNNAVKGSRLLPIDVKKYKKILVVGENATRSLCEGGGSSELKAKDEVSPLRGLQERFGKDAEIIYAQGYESGESHYGSHDAIAESLQDSLRNDAIEKAKSADLVIYIGGLNKNHFQDCEGGDRLSYNMMYGQDELISNLASVQPNFVCIIVSGTAIAMPWLGKVPALVQSWYLGSEAGHALADVISGDVNPSGKTIFTYANALTDYPAHMNGRISYPGVTPEEMERYTSLNGNETPKSADMLALNGIIKGIPADMKVLNTDFNGRNHWGKGNETELYTEDILVGYRWFDTKKKAVMFPFGYGLSYTTFQYGKGRLVGGNATDGYKFEISIKNTGSVAGKEVVQLYVGDDKVSVIRPQKELKAYAKVALQPGEEKVVSLSITPDDLKFFDEDKHEWVLEPGTFHAYIGASSRDIKAVVPFTANP